MSAVTPYTMDKTPPFIDHYHSFHIHLSYRMSVLMGHCLMIMLVIVAVPAMNMDMGMDVGMLMGMDGISMAVLMGMGVGMLVGVL